MPAAAVVAEPKSTGWLTLREVAHRLRFASTRAVADYLRRTPSVAVYRRVGEKRLFMRVEDVDNLMERVQLPTRAELDAADDAAIPRDGTFERVKKAGPRAVAPRRRGRK